MNKTVALLTYGKTKEHRHDDCVAVLQHQLGMLVIQTRGSMYIDLARSVLACGALAHGADVTVFIDHDILFDPLDVERLAEVARESRGVVGVPYSERNFNGAVVGGFDPVNEEVVFYEGGGLYPASGVIGMGFTAIHKDAYALLDAKPEYAQVNSYEGPVRPYFQMLFVEGHWLREDASFCHAVRVAGGSTLLDTRIRVKHLGEHPFGIDDYAVRPQDKPSLRLKMKVSDR